MNLRHTLARLLLTRDECTLVTHYRALSEQDRRYVKRIVQAMFLTTPPHALDKTPG